MRYFFEFIHCGKFFRWLGPVCVLDHYCPICGKGIDL